ncbi:MAG: DNA polymerase III subunit delta [Antricoccus sp.]
MSITTHLEKLILVIGEDEYLRSQAGAELVGAQRIARGGEIELIRVEAGTDATMLFVDAISPALFGGDRIVIVADADQATKDLVSAITSYVADPDPQISLIVLHSGGGRAKTLALQLQNSGALVERVPVVKTAEDRIRYVRDEVAAAGGTIDAKACAALVDALGEDLRSLSSAARQLAADSGGTVSSQTVHQYYRGRADVKTYAVADDVVAGEQSRALEQLRWALHDGTPEVVIADAIAESIRQAARVAAAGRADPNSLASSLGMPAWKIRRVRGSIAGWSAPGLTAAMRIVATLNADVKGSAADPRWALEKAILDICAARNVG